VYNCYFLLVPYIKYRADLHYILDQVNGELSVAHNFFLEDIIQKNECFGWFTWRRLRRLVAENTRWKIQRIYTTENWNPELSSSLQEPGLEVEKGNFIVGVNGVEMPAAED
jgi:tricorn protease